jgi:hypothetical protein
MQMATSSFCILASHGRISYLKLDDSSSHANDDNTGQVENSMAMILSWLLNFSIVGNIQLLILP